MCSVKQQSCDSFWRLTGLQGKHCNSTNYNTDYMTTTGQMTDDYGAVRLRAQHYNTTAALWEQFFKLDLLWARYSAI